MPRNPSAYSPQALATLDAEIPPVVQSFIADYNFASQGGAVGNITLVASPASALLQIPANAVITGGYIDVSVALVGATATIACQVEAPNDILTAVAVASWTTGRKNVLPAPTSGALTAGTQVKTTVPRDVVIVIATAALTAGAFRVVLFVETNPQ